MIVAAAERDIERARLRRRRQAGLSFRGDHTAQNGRNLAGKLPIGSSRKLSRRPGLAHDRDALADRHKRQEIVPPDVLGIDFWVTPKIGEALNQIVVNFRSRGTVTYNESLVHKITPAKLRFLRERMIAGKYGEYSLGPKLLCFTVRPMCGSRDKSHIELKSPDRGNVIRRIAVKKLDPYTCMLLAVGSQQIGQESRRERRKDSDLDMPPLGATYGGHILRAVVDLLKCFACSTHKLLSCQRQADAAVVPLK